MKKITLILICSLTCLNLSNAQLLIRGNVLEVTTELPLEGVVIQEATSGFLTVSDENGYYEGTFDQDTIVLTFSLIGYANITHTIVPLIVADSSLTMDYNVTLRPEDNVLQEVVVSGSRYEKNILEEALSIEVIKPKYIERLQATRLDQVLNRVPGLQIVDGQANLWGSGFSFGSGSRVGFVVDGLPYLAPENGNIPWEFIPMENIGQIEVLKGAASVLYGTSAINGLINVRTATPTTQPYTSISLYGGLYDTPSKAYQKWWTNDNRAYVSGAFLAHRQKIGTDFDLVLGAHTHRERSYAQGADDVRYRFNFNTRYRITDKLSIGLNGNIQRYTTGFFIFWQDSDSNALIHTSPIVKDNYLTYSIDPYITYVDKSNNKHALRTRFYNLTFLRLTTDPTPGWISHFDYQFQRKFDSGLILTSGATAQLIDVQSAFFELDTLTQAPSIKGGQIGAIYAQAEKRFLDDSLILNLGTRWEYYRFGEEDQAGLPVFRASANYKINHKNYLRAAFGQGYRLPSLLERYTDRSTGDANIFPNLDIQPEFGYSVELGYKKAFDTPNLKGYADISLIWMDMKDLIEYQFGFHAADTSLTALVDFTNYGFKSINITDAHILGYEISALLEGNFEPWRYRLWAGYTFTYPGDLAADTTLKNAGTYLNRFFRLLTASPKDIQSDTTLSKGILRYRSLHNVKLDAEISWKQFTLGFAANYNGWMVNVDEILVGESFWSPILESVLGDELFPGMKAYRAANVKGHWVFDLRLRYSITPKNHVNFVVNNLFNRNFAVRIGKLNPPRLFNLRYQMEF